MKNDKVKLLLCGLFFIALAAITFRCAWGADMVFSGSDENFGLFQNRKDLMPEYLTGFFRAEPILGTAASAFNLNHAITFMLPAELANDFRYGFFLSVSSLSLVWFLRMRGRTWLAAAAGALVAFWFGSVMLAAGGHIYKMAVLSLSVLSLCLLEKSVVAKSLKGAVWYAILSGVAVGVMILEQADVAILAGLFLGAYVLFRLIQSHRKKWMRWCCILVPLAAVGLSISAKTIFTQYEHNVVQSAAVQSEQGRWDFVTQWSMVPSEWPDLVASGWSGWGSNDPKGPYWGKIGRSAEWDDTRKGFFNFKITSVYMGVVPFLLGGFGLVLAFRNRKSDDGANVLFWSVAGLVGLWLAFGKYSILYKLFYQMPLVGNIRAPIKFLDNFQICLGIVAAYGIDHLLGGDKPRKGFVACCSVVAGLMLLAGMFLQVSPDARIQEFSQMGLGKYADLMVRNMSNAWLHGGLLALFMAGVAFFVWKKRKFAMWASMALVLVLGVDSVALTSRYFKADDVSLLKKGNIVLNFLKKNQGDDRVFLLSQQGIYNRWLAVDGPYHGLHFFNVWQMPRMATEYKNFLTQVGRNQIRLWELSAIKYVTAPSGIMEQIRQNPVLGTRLKPVMYYRFGGDSKGLAVTQLMKPELPNDQVLLEFTGGNSRFAMIHDWRLLPRDEHCRALILPSFDATKTVLVDAVHAVPTPLGMGCSSLESVEVLKSLATVRVKSDSPGILLFSQRLQPCWKVYVDGAESEILRCNYLCMGVYVPAGEHEIRFSL